ncbi:hypothetical protein VTL71DRAFT_8822 [Oculimacula yallundae]|uniref:Protein kinase domain-containing protein n=1 Tax=Oculimacula yallundae TaxID=86028 RepID=A0ABR4CYS3_9HELO
MVPAVDLTPELAYRTICPSTAFWVDITSPRDYLGDEQLAWDVSILNPQSRIDSLTPVQIPRWRIDGCTSLGNQFFTVPTFLSPLPPLRVDTFLPDPRFWPPGLRHDLGFDKAFLFRDWRINHFGICQHILRALEYWSDSFPDFGNLYRDLPFGSRIMFENMSMNIRSIRIRIARTHDLERQLLPLSSLKFGSHFPTPDTLDISQLTLIRQFQDSAALVRVSKSPDDDVVVFKTLSDEPKYLNHEMDILLSMPKHENIISRPSQIVTKRCKFGGKIAVVGFTIQYHAQGSLRDILPFRRLHGALKLQDKIKWATQVISALQHIKSKGPGWYCDLRLDNILLSDDDDVILIDFEQRGVLPAFASPLDNYLQYVNILVNDSSLDTTTRKEFKDLYDKHIRPFVPKRKDQHQGCVPWLCMSSLEREASELYMLGRLLWCIFEGVSAPQKEFWMEYKHEPEIEFPEFRDTPKQLRELILSCAPDWNVAGKRLQRKAFGLRFRDSSDGKDISEFVFRKQVTAAWHEEIERAKVFLGGRENRGIEWSEATKGRTLSLEHILKMLHETVP